MISQNDQMNFESFVLLITYTVSSTLISAYADSQRHPDDTC